MDPEFGTGCLKITPGHDPTDYAIGLQNELEIINIMGDDGHLNSNAGQYQGMERFAARKAVWKDIQVPFHVEGWVSLSSLSSQYMNEWQYSLLVPRGLALNYRVSQSLLVV